MRKNLKSAQEQEETAHRRLLEATEERERIEQKMIENAAKLENIAEQEQALTPASRSDADHKLKRLQAERDRLQLESSKLDTRLAILKKEREDVSHVDEAVGAGSVLFLTCCISSSLGLFSLELLRHKT